MTCKYCNDSGWEFDINIEDYDFCSCGKIPTPTPANTYKPVNIQLREWQAARNAKRNTGATA